MKKIIIKKSCLLVCTLQTKFPVQVKISNGHFATDLCDITQTTPPAWTWSSSGTDLLKIKSDYKFPKCFLTYFLVQKNTKKRAPRAIAQTQLLSVSWHQKLINSPEIHQLLSMVLKCHTNWQCSLINCQSFQFATFNTIHGT